MSFFLGLRHDRFEWRFCLNNIGAPPKRALAHYPPGIANTDDATGSADLEVLSKYIFGGDAHGLRSGFEHTRKKANRAWAAIYAWNRAASTDMRSLGLSDGMLKDPYEFVEGDVEQHLASLIPQECYQMSLVAGAVAPEDAESCGSDSRRGPVNTLQLIKAATTGGYHSADFTEVFGCWLATQYLETWSCIFPTEYLATYELSVDRLDGERRSGARPIWTLACYELSENQLLKAKALGWPIEQVDQFEASLPPELDPYAAGIVVARTLREVFDLHLQDEFWMGLNQLS